MRTSEAELPVIKPMNNGEKLVCYLVVCMHVPQQPIFTILKISKDYEAFCREQPDHQLGFPSLLVIFLPHIAVSNPLQMVASTHEVKAK